MDDDVVSFEDRLAPFDHGRRGADGAAVWGGPAQNLPSPSVGEQTRAPMLARAERLDQVPESSADARPTPVLAPMAARARRALARRRSARADGARLVRRAEKKTIPRRQTRHVGIWFARRTWWVIRGLGVAVRGLWRAVWQPEMMALARGIDDPARSHRARRELRGERRRTFAGVLILAALAYIAARQWGTEVLQHIAWWGYTAAGVVLLLALAAAGRPETQVEETRESAQEMPRSLALSSSDRGVAATLADAFADTKIRGQVNDVQRAPGGWGWTVTLSTLDGITETKLEALERYLNTPVGGLVFSPVNTAARVRQLRIVLADLLSTPTTAIERTSGSVLTPVDLATRFDGGRLGLTLFGQHMLIIGRTGSGKSGVLHDVVDALTSMTDATVDGLDLTGGPDLKSWKTSLRQYVGGPDFVRAEALLADNVARAKDRTSRLGERNWDPALDGPAHVLVIDEYGLVAESQRMRAQVEFLITYGAKAGVSVVLCAQRKVKEMMRSALIASQVHIKIYLGMSEEDAASLPKSVREQGVRPHLFQQATQTEPNDAGKGFVLGVEALPILVRFDRTDRASAVRRAVERAAGRPSLCARDQEVIRRADDTGVPDLILFVRDAILVAAGAVGRNPERASGEEIVAYLGKRGVRVDKGALVGELRVATGGLISRSRDTNLAPRSNPKGFYLEDIDAAIATLKQQRSSTQDTSPF